MSLGDDFQCLCNLSAYLGKSIWPYKYATGAMTLTTVIYVNTLVCIIYSNAVSIPAEYSCIISFQAGMGFTAVDYGRKLIFPWE